MQNANINYLTFWVSSKTRWGIRRYCRILPKDKRRASSQPAAKCQTTKGCQRHFRLTVVLYYLTYRWIIIFTNVCLQYVKALFERLCLLLEMLYIRCVALKTKSQHPFLIAYNRPPHVHREPDCVAPSTSNPNLIQTPSILHVSRCLISQFVNMQDFLVVYFITSWEM